MTPRQAIDRLSDALGSRRPVEPRLSAFVEHGACSDPPEQGARVFRVHCSGSPKPGSESHRAALELTLALEAATPADPTYHHVRGLSHLVWVDVSGSVDEALRDLETASAEDDSNVDIKNDLAAGYLVRGELNDDPLDLLHAVDLLQGALEIDGDLPAPRFNLALALEKLNLPHLARESWDSYLAIDPASGWAVEARRYRDRPAAPALRDSWNEARARILGTAEAEMEVYEAVDRHRGAARRWAEDELLGRWAREMDRGNSEKAARILSVIRLVGAALARFDRDHLLYDTAAVIDAAGDRTGRLVRGHLAYARGSDLLRERQARAARDHLAAATLTLEACGSPFHWRARFLEMRSDYRAGRREEAVRMGRELIAEISPAARYPVLLGRTHWVMGTALVALGRPGPAEAAYLRALEHLDLFGDPEGSIAVETFLAQVYDDLGDSREAWRRRRRALRLLDRHPVPRRWRLFTTGAAFSAAELQEPRTALLFANASLKLAREHARQDPPAADAAAIATRLCHRATFRRMLGRYEASLKDLDEAKRFFEEVESETDRRTLLPEILLEEARTRAAARHPEALEIFEEAEAAFQEAESSFYLGVLLRERARLRAALGDLDGAAADLDQAIEIAERQRVDLDRPWHRMSFFDRVGRIFDEKIGLMLRRDATPESLLQAAERARSRVLLDWLLDLGGSAPKGLLREAAGRRAAPLHDLLARLPATTAALQYKLLEDRLLVWLAHDGDVSLEVREVTPSILEALVASFRTALISGDGGRASGAELARLLLPRQLARSAGLEELVIAGDGVLDTLPFSALPTPRGTRLVEDHRLVFVPSFQVYAELLDSTPDADLRSGRFLVAADPAFDRERYDLPRLEGARLEARIIRDHFADVRLLLGAEATPSALSAEIDEARVFHYAGHALANWHGPLRSSLLLTPEPGRPGSGTVLAHHLLELPLGSTRLAVLSACRTAYGGRPSREGVLGLVWPFLARGVPSVVASLWQVDDDATAELFSAFYEALAAGHSPDEALRSAQLARSAESDSFDWAAFQIYGAGGNRAVNENR